MTKRKLGKGLEAFMPEGNSYNVLSQQEKGAGVVEELPLKLIRPNPNQPRKDFDDEKLKEMAATMENVGVIQPIIVLKRGDQYILVAGERRLRAAEIAGLETIPALVRDFPAEQVLAITLIENLQREDLNPIEEANACKTLLQEFGLTQDELASRLGKSRSAIANNIRLLSLDPLVQNYLEEGLLSVGQARPLLALTNGETQREMAAQVVTRQLNARQVEKLLRTYKQKTEEKPKEQTVKEQGVGQLLLDELEEKIRKQYGTKVIIKKSGQEGKIELYFYSDDDLERLALLMLNGEKE